MYLFNAAYVKLQQFRNLEVAISFHLKSQESGQMGSYRLINNLFAGTQPAGDTAGD